MIRFLIRCSRSIRTDRLRFVYTQLTSTVHPQTELNNFAPILKPSFNLAAFANDSEILQQFIKLGVNLSKFEKDKEICNFIIALNFERDVKNHIRFLCDHGVNPDHLGLFLTRNPFIFKETLDDLQTRINYLMYKKFDKESISRILTLNPKWLSTQTIEIDRRLGYFQSTFKLNGSEVRLIATRCPRLITNNFANIDLVKFSLREEMGFEFDECKHVLLSVPKIFTMNKELLLGKFDYVHNTMEIANKQIMNFPQIFYCRRSRLEQRHRFLQLINRAQYDPESANFISLKSIAIGTDTEFVTNVAKSSLDTFNLFLKTL